MDEIARADAGLRQCLLCEARRGRLGAMALQRRGARWHADHAYRGLRARQGQVRHHRICADRREAPGRASRCCSPRAAFCRNIMSARRRGAPRTAAGIHEDVLEIHPHDAEHARRARRRLGARAEPRRRDDIAREDHRPHGAGRRLHDLPPPACQTNVITTDNSDWATNCPEYKVTAVQISPSNGPTEWQERYREIAETSRRIAPRSSPAGGWSPRPLPPPPRFSREKGVCFTGMDELREKSEPDGSRSRGSNGACRLLFPRAGRGWV